MKPAALLTVLCLLSFPPLPAGPAAPATQPAAESQTQAQAPGRKAEVPSPASIPPEEKGRKNPFPGSAKSIELGRNLFKSQCAMCHGATGDGKGDLAMNMGWKISDFTRSDRMAKRTDGEIFYIISQGHGQMPGTEGRLQVESRWHLVNLIRSLAKAGGASN